MHLRLFGGFRLEQDGEGVAVAAGSRRLLAALGVSGETTRTALAGTLWPDTPRERAQGRLRTSLWRLGEFGRLVQIRGERLELADDIEVDTRSFVRRALRLDHGAGLDEPELDALTSGAGELLPGWYDEWVLFERERLRQLRLHALDTVATALCCEGRYAAAIDAALHAIRLDPFRESAHRILVGVHLREENLSEALRHFHAFRRLLRQELGVDPSARFVDLIALRCPRVDLHQHHRPHPTGGTTTRGHLAVGMST